MVIQCMNACMCVSGPFWNIGLGYLSPSHQHQYDSNGRYIATEYCHSMQRNCSCQKLHDYGTVTDIL